MNTILIISGTTCLSLWSLMTAMTRGLPEPWCRFLARVAPRSWDGEIARLANGFYYDVPNRNMPTIAFLAVFFLVFGAVAFVSNHVEKHPARRHSLFIIMLFAVLLRLSAWPGILVHENDIYRYLWDGRSLCHGVNPYKYAPAELFVFQGEEPVDYRSDDYAVVYRARDYTAADRAAIGTLNRQRAENTVLFARIGHKPVPTVYPPAAELFFALSARLKPQSIYFMKGLFVLLDLGVIALIVGILRRLKLKPEMCVVYAWSPLVIKEYANAGHYDPLAVFFMLLAVLLFLQGREAAGVAALAISFLSKFFALPLLPFFLVRKRMEKIAIFTGVAMAFYVPFWVWGGAGQDVFEGLQMYGRQWTYNGSLFAALFVFLEKISPQLAATLVPAKVMAGLMFSGVILFQISIPTRDTRHFVYKCFMSSAWLFLLNPVGDPWYFCWLMPFVCIFPRKSFVLLSGLLALSYLNFRPDLAWTEVRFLRIPLLSWIIYLPFFLLFIAEECKASHCLATNK